VKQEGSLPKLLIGAGLMALLLYVAGFTLNQHLRARRGPWEVTFQAAPGGDTRIRVVQPALGIGPIDITFAGQPYTNEAMTVLFDAPRKAVPIGRVKYDELTFLPGVVTLDLFGHEIELLPRTLYVNRQPREWSAGPDLILIPHERPNSLHEP